MRLRFPYSAQSGDRKTFLKCYAACVVNFLLWGTFGISDYLEKCISPMRCNECEETSMNEIKKLNQMLLVVDTLLPSGL